MVRSVVWQREKWVASNPRKDEAKRGSNLMTAGGGENKNSTRLCVQYYRPDTSMRSVYALGLVLERGRSE
jgi:hypothetical protein